jgi:hypothetical protein
VVPSGRAGQLPRSQEGWRARGANEKTRLLRARPCPGRLRAPPGPPPPSRGLAGASSSPPVHGAEGPHVMGGRGREEIQTGILARREKAGEGSRAARRAARSAGRGRPRGPGLRRKIPGCDGRATELSFWAAEMCIVQRGPGSSEGSRWRLGRAAVGLLSGLRGLA